MVVGFNVPLYRLTPTGCGNFDHFFIEFNIKLLDTKSMVGNNMLTIRKLKHPNSKTSEVISHTVEVIDARYMIV